VHRSCCISPEFRWLYGSVYIGVLKLSQPGKVNVT
jgi:hypothetical protein